MEKQDEKPTFTYRFQLFCMGTSMQQLLPSSAQQITKKILKST